MAVPTESIRLPQVNDRALQSRALGIDDATLDKYDITLGAPVPPLYRGQVDVPVVLRRYWIKRALDLRGRCR